MNVLIFGYGLHGVGFDSAMYCLSRGDNVRLTDIRPRDMLGESIDFLESKGAVIHCGGHMTEDFIWADVVIKSPAIRLNNEFLAFSKRTENDITFCSDREELHKLKLICVTGARNKTTTASAICHVLNTVGIKAHMCGNMGISAFSEMRRWDEGDVPQYLVLEMSAWQARDVYTFMKGRIPHVEVSAITSTYDTNPTEESLELDDMAKLGEFNHHANHIICPSEVKDGISKIVAKKAKNVSSIESASKPMSKSIPSKYAAAFAVLRKLGLSSGQINSALKSYKGNPGRNQMVLRTENALYINDSSTRIPAAVNFSMDNYESLPVHLICGGSDSTLAAEEMLKSLRTAASIHLLEGSFTEKRLIPLLKKEKIAFNGPYRQMEEAVSSASSRLDKRSRMLQIVLLSPGASSYEMFGNELNRGECFCSAVLKQNSTK